MTSDLTRLAVKSNTKMFGDQCIGRTSSILSGILSNILRRRGVIKEKQLPELNNKSRKHMEGSSIESKDINIYPRIYSRKRIIAWKKMIHWQRLKISN